MKPKDFDILRDNETAWMYCRECDKFNDGEHPERPCSGKAFDYEIKDGKPPCENYYFDNKILENNNCGD